MLAAGLRRLFYSPARKFAAQMLDFDEAVGESGLATAARRTLQKFVQGVRITSDAPLPAGPFLALSNRA